MGPGVAGADLHFQVFGLSQLALRFVEPVRCKPLEAQKERERLLEKAQRHEDGKFVGRNELGADFNRFCCASCGLDASPRRSMSSVRPLLSTSMGPQFRGIFLPWSVLM